MFEQSSLATLNCELRYVPIIMPPEMAARYPARSRLRRREALYDCAPQLDFDVFVNGDLTQQLTEYIAGIATSAPHLAKLGASKQQIADFELILAQAVEQILVLRPDQTRH